MMLESIKKAAAGNAKVSDYRITETRKEGMEWYFVRSDLDCARSVDTVLYEVCVYADAGSLDTKTRGECSFFLHPGTDEADILLAVERAATTAAGMKNPWFPLPEKTDAKPSMIPAAFDGMDGNEAMEKIRKALYANDGKDGATVNSLEIFLSKVTTRVLTSRGVDVSWSGWNGYSEFVVNAGPRGKDEVELFADIAFSDFDETRLSGATTDLLKAASDRLRAVPTPSGKNLPLLLSGELSGDICRYWFANLNGQMAYEKVAAFALGDDLGKEGGNGDKVTLKAVPSVKGAPGGAPYDQTGFLLKPVTLAENGKVKAYVSSVKYAHYLKNEPTGGMTCFEVAPGRRSAAELRSGDYLEVKTFSDFFVNSMTGDFGGEIRLGYLVQGGKKTPVTGGSVTGTMNDNRGKVLISLERVVVKNALVPEVCALPEVTITGT